MFGWIDAIDPHQINLKSSLFFFYCLKKLNKNCIQVTLSRYMLKRLLVINISTTQNHFQQSLTLFAFMTITNLTNFSSMQCCYCLFLSFFYNLLRANTVALAHYCTFFNTFIYHLMRHRHDTQLNIFGGWKD